MLHLIKRNYLLKMVFVHRLRVLFSVEFVMHSLNDNYSKNYSCFPEY